MAGSCIKRRMLFACVQTYDPDRPAATARQVGWTDQPARIIGTSPHHNRNIDFALVGRIPEGILVAFRGTLPPFTPDAHESLDVILDWLNNVEFVSHQNSHYPGGVHKGFSGSVDRLWRGVGGAGGVEKAIRDRIRPGLPNKLFVTGHSKGGALAVLAAWRALAVPGLESPIRVFTIAAARAGNEDFRDAFQAERRLSCVRYEGALDIVPHVPFGAGTPSWVRTIVNKIWAGLDDLNYVPVGARMPASTSLADRARALARWSRFLAGGPSKQAYAPVLAVAHSIAPGSGYDILVCTGEGGCTHA